MSSQRCFLLFFIKLLLCTFLLLNCLSDISAEQDPENYSYNDSDENLAQCSEQDHNKTCCHDNEFQCGNGECITLDKVCTANVTYLSYRYYWFTSNINKCSDHTDIIGCSTEPCKDRTPKCSQTCIDLPNNKSRCTCYKGYALAHSSYAVLCKDVDECAIGVHSCSHNCVNLNGTFSCSCKEGFKNDNSKSNSTCYVADNNTVVLYNWRNWIFSYNHSEGKSLPMVRSGRVDNMDYDPANDVLYWSNSTSVTRSYIPGARNGTVTIGHAQEVGVPEFRDNIVRNSLAVDWTAGNLYWLSSDTLNTSVSQIMVSKLDGRYVKTIIEIPQASSLVLDPEFGRMYWASGGTDPHIGSAWMNGMLRSIIKRLPGQNPIALTLDHLSNGRLYWVDSINNTIYYIFKDGTRPTKVITTTPEQSPTSLDIFENNLYWITKESKELLSIDKFGKDDVKVLIVDLDKESTLLVYHKKKIDKVIRQGTLYCKTQCSHLCLHIPRGYSCTCPDGNKLVSLNGEIVCDNQQESPEDDPLDCNCNDKEKICNTTSPYRHCICNADCPDGLEDFDYTSEVGTLSQDYGILFSSLSFILICIFGVLVIIATILSFYKRDNVT